MYLFAKSGGHRPYWNGDTNSYTNSYMDTSKKAKFTASIRYIEKFLESGIAIYNAEVPDMPGRKTRKIRRTRSCKALCSRKHIKTIFVYWLDNLTYWYHQLEMVKWKVLGILLSILLLIENWIISYYKMKSFLYQNISIYNKVQ